MTTLLVHFIFSLKMGKYANCTGEWTPISLWEWEKPNILLSQLLSLASSNGAVDLDNFLNMANKLKSQEE